MTESQTPETLARLRQHATHLRNPRNLYLVTETRVALADDLDSLLAAHERAQREAADWVFDEARALLNSSGAIRFLADRIVSRFSSPPPRDKCDECCATGDLVGVCRNQPCAAKRVTP